MEQEAPEVVELDALDESGLWEKAEAYGLLGPRWLERRALERFLERFAASTNAPEACLSLARLHFTSGVNWESSVERFRSVFETYPDTDAADLARIYYEALTAPRDALGLEVLQMLFEQPQAPRGMPLYKRFLVGRVAEWYAQGSMREWISEDSELSQDQKASLARGVAQMLLAAEQPEESRVLCDWIVSTYPDASASCAAAVVLKGWILLDREGDAAGGEETFRSAAAAYPGEDVVAWAYYQLAWAYLNRPGGMGDAVRVAREVRERWPYSRWSLESWNLLSSEEVAAEFGAPSAQTAAERAWERFLSGTPLEDLLSEDLPEEVLEQLISSPGSLCGPWAFARICELLEGEATPSRLLAFCRTRPGGAMSFGDLLRGFERAGYEAKAERMGVRQLLERAQGGGVRHVLHLGDHYTVVESADASGVVVSDSESANQRLDRVRLGLRWDGYVLSVSPGPGRASASSGAGAESRRLAERR